MDKEEEICYSNFDEYAICIFLKAHGFTAANSLAVRFSLPFLPCARASPPNINKTVHCNYSFEAQL